MHVNSFNKTRQSKQLRPKTTPFFSREKMSCLRRDLNPRCPVFQADAPPAEPLRQLSWAGRVFKVYTRQMASLP